MTTRKPSRTKKRVQALAEALLRVHQAEEHLRDALRSRPDAVLLHAERQVALDAAAAELAETLAALHPVEGDSAL